MPVVPVVAEKAFPYKWFFKTRKVSKSLTGFIFYKANKIIKATIWSPLLFYQITTGKSRGS